MRQIQSLNLSSLLIVLLFCPTALKLFARPSLPSRLLSEYHSQHSIAYYSSHISHSKLSPLVWYFLSTIPLEPLTLPICLLHSLSNLARIQLSILSTHCISLSMQIVFMPSFAYHQPIAFYPDYLQSTFALIQSSSNLIPNHHLLRIC